MPASTAICHIGFAIGTWINIPYAYVDNHVVPIVSSDGPMPRRTFVSSLTVPVVPADQTSISIFLSFSATTPWRTLTLTTSACFEM